MKQYLFRALLLSAIYLVVSFLRHQVWSDENGFVLSDAILQATGTGALMAVLFPGNLRRTKSGPASGKEQGTCQSVKS